MFMYMSHGLAIPYGRSGNLMPKIDDCGGRVVFECNARCDCSHEACRLRVIGDMSSDIRGSVNPDLQLQV